MDASRSLKPNAITAALSSLSNNITSPKGPFCGWNRSVTPPNAAAAALDSTTAANSQHALIMVDITTAYDDNGDAMLVTAVQFNNLDVIANQETIVELVSFAQYLIETLSHSRTNIDSAASKSGDVRESSPSLSATQMPQLEVTFDFHRFSVLLLRSTTMCKALSNVKLATATISGARIQASVDTKVTISGSLGGLQICDLVSENSRHRQIFSVGNELDHSDRLPPLGPDSLTKLGRDLYRCHSGIFPDGQATPDETPKALQFTVLRRFSNVGSLNNVARPIYSEETSNDLLLYMRMASVCYVHSPRLLDELTKCAMEFKRYVAKLATSIKSAATEVAKGIVRPPNLTEEDEISVLDIRLRLDVVLDTPILVFPHDPTKPDVLLAHLGRIFIHNTFPGDDSQIHSIAELNSSVFVDFRDTNIFSLNTDLTSCDTLTTLYDCTKHGRPILHDTMLTFTIRLPTTDTSDWYRGTDESLGGTAHNSHDYSVSGNVVGSLKLVLTKRQYEQVLKTFEAVTTSGHPRPETVNQYGTSGAAAAVNPIAEDKLPAENSGFNRTQVTFTVPEFIVEMSDDLSNSDVGFVRLRVDEFYVELEQLPEEIRAQVSLRSLLMEDLLEPADSKHRVLIRSTNPDDDLTESKDRAPLIKHEYLSTSCPTFGERYPSGMHPCSSLPDKLCTRNAFLMHLNTARRRKKGYHFRPRRSTECGLSVITGFNKSAAESTSCDGPQSPCITSPDDVTDGGVKDDVTAISGHMCITPPPSPLPLDDDDDDYDESRIRTFRGSCALASLAACNRDSTLVEIHIVQSTTTTKDRTVCTKRTIFVDFNSLDISVNSQPWVMVLDFLSSPSMSKEAGSQLGDPIASATYQPNRDAGVFSKSEPALRPLIVEVDLRVQKLALTLRRPSYGVCQASISHLASRSTHTARETEIRGRLGKVLVIDLSTNGGNFAASAVPSSMYKERFITSGPQALHFRFNRHHEPDPYLTRDCDMELDCTMTAVYAVYTHRFVCELLDFYNDFSQLQVLLARLQDGRVTKPERQPRLNLSVSASAPVVVIPKHSTSADALVVNLGNLTISTTFMHHECRVSTDEDSDPVLTKCLLQVMQIELTEMDLYAGRYALIEHATTTAVVFPSFAIVPAGPSFLQERFILQLKVSRNLDSLMYRPIPDWTVEGGMSSVLATVDQSQYLLLHGILVGNLSEQTQSASWNLAPSGIHVANNTCQNFTGESSPLSYTSPAGSLIPGTMLAIHVDLVNVTIKFVSLRAVQLLPRSIMLAQVDLIESHLSVLLNSDGTKDVDLVSHEIRLIDTRFADLPEAHRPNVFTNLLKPIRFREKESSTSPPPQQSTSTSSTNMAAAAEEPSKNLQAEIHYRTSENRSRLTILLNGMRVMGVFDWIEEMGEFLRVTPPLTTCNDTVVSGTHAQQQPHQHQQHRKLQRTTSFSQALGSPKKVQPYVEFEFKLNMMETEVIIIECPSKLDSNAVIARSTALVKYHTASQSRSVHKPLCCHLQNLEVFSCVLGMEEETALSILDPVSINIEMLKQSNAPGHMIEVSANSLTLRLSYQDILLFFRIGDSVPRQWKSQDVGHVIAYNTYASSWNKIDEVDRDVCRLVELGFNLDDCRRALAATNNDIEEAALWLTTNASTAAKVSATPVVAVSTSVDDLTFFSSTNAATSIQMSSPFKDLRTVQIRVADINLCLIDDCMDADVPLLELRLKDVKLTQDVYDVVKSGSAHLSLTVDFYNRALSGWEPVIEPWNCLATWKIVCLSNGVVDKLKMVLEAAETLNVNITSSQLDVWRRVSASWSRDLSEATSSTMLALDGAVAAGINANNVVRRRSSFVPFAVKNETGVPFSFTTLINVGESTTVNSGEASTSSTHPQLSSSPTHWSVAKPGQVVPINFKQDGKLRHHDSHRYIAHQIVIRLEGCHQLDPVSIDRVGTFFRYARPAASSVAQVGRVVFGIELEGSARKLIRVRSAFCVRNTSDLRMELQLTTSQHTIHSSNYPESVRCRALTVEPGDTLSLPFAFVYAEVKAKPSDQAALLHTNIEWNQATNERPEIGYFKMCTATRSGQMPFWYSVVLRRELYPIILATRAESEAPCHLVTIGPPLKITNLLPCELFYSFKEPRVLKGRIAPNKPASFHQFNTADEFIRVEFALENYQSCAPLHITAGNTAAGSGGAIRSETCQVRLELRDSDERVLVLNAIVYVLSSMAVRIEISAPFWMINRSCLPLIFKQHEASVESAGQTIDHERARCISPFLFSFADNDLPHRCCMRIGNLYHPNDTPKWSQPFSLESGNGVRKLVVISHDARPERVYFIGMEVRSGKGRYRNTRFVLLSPRFLLINRCQQRVEFCQKFASQNEQLSRSAMSALPDASLVFHWSRVDLDNLLCIRLPDVPGCMWSGGFPVDTVGSRHVHLRAQYGGMSRSIFLLLEVRLESATYHVIVSEADKYPHLMRIDNFSEVQIMFHQTNVCDDRLRYTVKAHSSLPYAWDEPTLKPYITVTAPGGMSDTYDMTIFREGNNIRYENYFYICFTGTFQKPRLVPHTTKDIKSEELVLDVIDNRVVINRKCRASRSQLWRQTEGGMLQHEGSSAPRDLRSNRSSSSSSNSSSTSSSSYFYSKHQQPAGGGTGSGTELVLDVAGLGPEPTGDMDLALRRPDPRRRLTQTWTFTSDGRLRCEVKNVCVQPKGGLQGLRRGSPVVLGPERVRHSEMMFNGNPIETAMSYQRMHEGSGVIAVNVEVDGPTIVLRIVDKNLPMSDCRSSGCNWLHNDNAAVIREARTPHSLSELQFELKMTGGLGISVIDREELIYALFDDIVCNFRRLDNAETFDMSIRDLQADNQLRGAERSCALFVAQQNRPDRHASLPVLILRTERVLNSTTSADAFIFKHVMVECKPIRLILEEELLLKLCLMFRCGLDDCQQEPNEIIGDSIPNMLRESRWASTIRLYLGTFTVSIPSCMLSVLTLRSNASSSLRNLRKQLGWSMYRFEDAPVELDEFRHLHSFETLEFFMNAVMDHYVNELKRRAGIIFVSVDFLGNPLGFCNEVAGGINELINDRNPLGFVRSLTYGISDSAAKFTGSLSDGIKTISSPNEQTGQPAVPFNEQSTSVILKGGFRGLRQGVLDGATNLFVQPYQGFVRDGVTGFFEGIGRGLANGILLPSAGLLDLAQGVASAVRENTRSTSNTQPQRFRTPRLVTTLRGLLPCYSRDAAIGNEEFQRLREEKLKQSPPNEIFVGACRIQQGAYLVVTSERVLLRSISDRSEYRSIALSHLSRVWFDANNSGRGSGSGAVVPSIAFLLIDQQVFRVATTEDPTVIQQFVDVIDSARQTYDERCFTLHLSAASTASACFTPQGSTEEAD